MTLSNFPRPFIGLPPRTAWLRATLLCGSFLGMLLSAPLWWCERFFPLLPAISSLPAIPAPWDRMLFGATLASLVAAFWFYRPAIAFFLASTVFLCLQDQNRCQPWLYLYWVMLLATLVPEPSGTSACRIMLSAVYLWAGVQKINSRYFHEVSPWFVSPALGWGLSSSLVAALQWAVMAAPVAEILIGLALWVPQLRKLALATAVLIHGAALVFLGPAGHNLNRVVWPWNLAMLGLVFALFPANPPARFVSTWKDLWASSLAATLTLVVCLLPVISRFGWCDKVYSFSLYSGDQATADIFVSEVFADRLPARMKAHVHRVQQEFHPDLQGPFVFDYITWAIHETGAPPLLEPRSYSSVYQFLRKYAVAPADIRMIVEKANGKTFFYQGDQVGELNLPSSAPAKPQP